MYIRTCTCIYMYKMYMYVHEQYPIRPLILISWSTGCRIAQQLQCITNKVHVYTDNIQYTETPCIVVTSKVIDLSHAVMIKFKKTHTNTCIHVQYTYIVCI